MKKLPAVIAVVVTALAAGVIVLAIGVNAFLNTVRPAQASTAADTQAVSAAAAPDTAQADAQIAQLEARIAEYQQREQQYQSQVNQLQDELQQANSGLNQYQVLFQDLQNMGVIRVSSDGQVSIPRLLLSRGDDD